MVNTSTNESAPGQWQSASEAQQKPLSDTVATDIEHQSAFDLATSLGGTESERFLANLCQKSFLRLWSYPNTFTDEGIRDGKASSGNEFTDVLIVFGNDVILFSDKHVKFNSEKTLEIAWPRWFKGAVAKSSTQLYGALNWAKRFPTRIFLDPKCTRPLPTKIPPPEKARYHLVATTRGSTAECAAHFNKSIGSHKIDSSVHGADHKNHPFTVGLIDPKKQFIHVFDELSLELLLRELDTAPDFISYLQAREEFLTSTTTKVVSAGEEQLLAAYMSNMQGETHQFLPHNLSDKAPSVILFDESHWPTYVRNPQYNAKKAADRNSYLWDALLNRFIAIGHPKYMGSSATQEEHEAGLRQIASTGRFERRYLSDALTNLRNDAFNQPMVRRARMLTTLQNPDIGYVFLIFPKRAEWDYQTYRQERAACLNTYLLCARLRFREVGTFVGLALDHPIKDYQGGSEDIGIHRFPEGEEVDWVELRRLADEANIINEDSPTQWFITNEFPQPSPIHTKNKKKKNKKNKSQRQSRRNNRK